MVANAIVFALFVAYAARLFWTKHHGTRRKAELVLRGEYADQALRILRSPFLDKAQKDGRLDTEHLKLQFKLVIVSLTPIFILKKVFRKGGFHESI